MAKLVYSACVQNKYGEPCTLATYSNADYIIVKPVGQASISYSGSTVNAATEIGSTNLEYKIMKGCSGLCTVYWRYRSERNSLWTYTDIEISYNANGVVSVGNIDQDNRLSCHIEFYKQS